ncbi:MAG: hypothetical protein ACOX88_08145 [Christensenellales bacterium]|jgi:hypothetical protein
MKKLVAVCLLCVTVLMAVAGCSRLPGDVETPQQYEYQVNRWTINDAKLWDKELQVALSYGMYHSEIEEIYTDGEHLFKFGAVDIYEYPGEANLWIYYRDDRAARFVVNALYGDRFETFRGVGTTSLDTAIIERYGQATDTTRGDLRYKVWLRGQVLSEIWFAYDPTSETTSIMVGDAGADLSQAFNAMSGPIVVGPEYVQPDGAEDGED